MEQNCGNRQHHVGVGLDTVTTSMPLDNVMEKKDENCAGVYNRSEDLNKPIEQTKHGNCDTNALAALMRRQQILVQW